MNKKFQSEFGLYYYKYYGFTDDYTIKDFLNYIVNDDSISGIMLYEDVDGEMRTVSGSYEKDFFVDNYESLLSKSLFPEAITFSVRINNNYDGNNHLTLTVNPNLNELSFCTKSADLEFDDIVKKNKINHL